jgi:Transposase, Mutator family
MTRKQNSAEKARWKEELRQWLREDRDLLRGLVEEAVQQVLEAEMEEALQAEKGERTAQRLGYRSGHYSRTLVTRVGKIELRGATRMRIGSKRCSISTWNRSPNKRRRHSDAGRRQPEAVSLSAGAKGRDLKRRPLPLDPFPPYFRTSSLQPIC